jgi:hypothetical protein
MSGRGRTTVALVALTTVALVAGVGPASGVPRPSDGATLQPEYRWVEPPPESVERNVVPLPTSVVVAAGGDATIATEDRQLVVRIDPTTMSAPEVLVSITPLAGSSLPALPDGLIAAGNAYRIEVAEPGAPDRPVAVDASVVLVAPLVPTGTFRLDQSTGWTSVAPAAATSETSGVVRIGLPATVVVGAEPDAASVSTARAADDGASQGRAWWWWLTTTIAALLLVGGWVWRRRAWTRM